MSFQIIKDKNNEIILGKGCRYHLTDLCSNLNDISSAIILCDENTKVYCLPLLKPLFEKFTANVHVIELPAGEKTKSAVSFNALIERLLDFNVDRKSLLINVGGGVITDLGAYVASVYKRGMRFVNIPTSLIGQIDAGIGNKSGINFGHLKNILGAFTKPECVIMDFDFLETLPDREFKSAYTEILKYGIIRDLNLYENLIYSCVHDIKDNIMNGAIIKACIDSKMHFVNEDLLDLRERNALNFGHTIGHAIESAYNDNGSRILHGEAVGIGIIAALYISERIFNIDRSILEKSQNFILENTAFFDIHEIREKVINYLYQDKKNENGNILFTLLKELGTPAIKQKVELKMIENALDYYSDITN